VLATRCAGKPGCQKPLSNSRQSADTYLHALMANHINVTAVDVSNRVHRCTRCFVDGGFTKLYGDRLLRSSIWLESIEVRVLWFFFLAAADADGVVDIPNVKVLAHLANMPLDACERALMVLESPDSGSRSPDLEGRRVIRDGSTWKIVTHNKYRELRTFRQVKDAQRQAEKRARTRVDMSDMSADEVDAYQESTPEAEAEAEAEGEGEREREPAAPLAAPTRRPRASRKPTPAAEAKAELRKAVTELAPSFGFEATPTAGEGRWAMAAKTVLSLAANGATRRDAALRAAGVALSRLKAGKSTSFSFALTDVAGALSEPNPLTDPGTPATVRTFYSRLLEHIGTRPHWDARDAAKHIGAISKWAEQFPDPKAELTAVFEAYLADEWARRNQYPLAGLSSSLPQLHAKSKGAA
jgi:flagellar basal body rod protein FlgC